MKNFIIIKLIVAFLFIIALLAIVPNYDQINVNIFGIGNISGIGKTKDAPKDTPKEDTSKVPKTSSNNPPASVETKSFINAEKNQIKITLISRLPNPETEVNLDIYEDEKIICTLFTNHDHPVSAKELLLPNNPDDSFFHSFYIVAKIKYLFNNVERSDEVRKTVKTHLENNKKYEISRYYYIVPVPPQFSPDGTSLYAPKMNMDIIADIY